MWQRLQCWRLGHDWYAPLSPYHARIYTWLRGWRDADACCARCGSYRISEGQASQ